MSRHLAIARHHVEQSDHGEDRGVRGAEKQQEKNDADDPAERLPEKRPEIHRAKIFTDETQGIFAAESKRLAHRVRAIGQLNSRVWIDRQHRPTEERRSENDLDRDRPDRSGGFAPYLRLSDTRAGVEFHDAGQIRDRLDTAKGKNHADELHPKLRETFMRSFQVLQSEMRRTHTDQNHNHDHGGDSESDGDASAVSRTEIIYPAHYEQHHRRGNDDVLFENGYAEITQGRPATERGGHGEIGHEQERPHHGEQATLRSRRGIDATSFRKVATDDGVINSNKTGENADCQNDRKRGEAGGKEGEADDVGFARSPIAVKKGGGALPIDVTRAMNVRARRGNQISHCDGLSVARLTAGKFFLGLASQMHGDLDLSRLWEHVHRCHRLDRESFLQFREIARQRGRIAGNVNERCRNKIDNHFSNLRAQSHGWRIDDHRSASRNLTA